jgi:hypothetical protein
LLHARDAVAHFFEGALQVGAQVVQNLDHIFVGIRAQRFGIALGPLDDGGGSLLGSWSTRAQFTISGFFALEVHQPRLLRAPGR